MPDFTIHRRKQKTAQSRPVGSVASLDSISKDGGVVLRIQLMIDAALSTE